MKFPSFRLLLTTIFITFGGTFHFGYQISIVNPTALILKKFFNESIQYNYDLLLTDSELTWLLSTAVGILIFGALFGSSVSE